MTWTVLRFSALTLGCLLFVDLQGSGMSFALSEVDLVRFSQSSEELLATHVGSSEAVETESSNSALMPIRYVPPPDRGTPPSGRGTGSRGNCLHPPGLPSLAALVGQPHLSLTVSDRPTLWFYSPYTAENADYGELIIQDDATDQELYRQPFLLGSEPGVQGLSFPLSVALAEGDRYRWYVDIHCHVAEVASGVDIATPASLTGVVERVPRSVALSQSLGGATADERLAIYGHHHIWYDLLTELAHLRLTHVTPDLDSDLEPDAHLEQLWLKVLSDAQGANLSELASLPLRPLASFLETGENSYSQFPTKMNGAQ